MAKKNPLTNPVPILVGILYFIGLSIWACLNSSPVETNYTITAFESKMVIEKNASVRVDESIKIDFKGAPRHGIIREIPCTAVIQGKNMQCQIRPIATFCDNAPVDDNVTVEGGKIRLKIGNPNITISGTHVYDIKYSVDGAVIFSGGKPWFYWNVTGNEWKMPINEAKGILILPSGVSPRQARVSAYMGKANSQQPGQVIADDKQICCSATNLSPGCGLTLSAILPPGSMQLPVGGQLSGQAAGRQPSGTQPSGTQPSGTQPSGTQSPNLLIGLLLTVVSFMVGNWVWVLTIVVSAIIFLIGYYQVMSPDVSHDPFDPQADISSSSGGGSSGGGGGGGFGGGGGDAW